MSRNIEPDSLNKTLTYQETVLRQIDRLGRFIPDAAVSKGGLNTYEVLAAFMAVRILHATIKPAAQKNGEYQEKVAEFKSMFSNLDFDMVLEDKIKRMEALNNILDWLEVECSQFGMIGILPMMEENLDMSTKEQKIREDKERSLRLAVKLLREHGSGILEAVKTEKEKKAEELDKLSPTQKKFKELSELSYKDVVRMEDEQQAEMDAIELKEKEAFRDE